jgi:hypothetical protein
MIESSSQCLEKRFVLAALSTSANIMILTAAVTVVLFSSAAGRQALRHSGG